MAKQLVESLITHGINSVALGYLVLIVFKRACLHFLCLLLRDSILSKTLALITGTLSQFVVLLSF